VPLVAAALSLLVFFNPRKTAKDQDPDDCGGCRVREGTEENHLPVGGRKKIPVLEVRSGFFGGRILALRSGAAP